jgi:hypothetical protein
MRGRVVRALGSPEEKADIIGPHKWPGFVGERKETLAYGRAATAFLPEGTQGSHCTQPSGLCRSCRPGGARGRVSKREGLRLLVPHWRSELHRSDLRQPLDDGPRVQPSCAADASRTGEAGSDAPPVSGGAMSTMRVHAVAATAIAPITAIACRQPSAGMPICARPSAA